MYRDKKKNLNVNCMSIGKLFNALQQNDKRRKKENFFVFRMSKFDKENKILNYFT